MILFYFISFFSEKPRGYLLKRAHKDIEPAQFRQPHEDVRTTLFCFEMVHPIARTHYFILYLSYLGIVRDYGIRLFAFKERNKLFRVHTTSR